MRQLASIQKIKALEPIENADTILKATVLGWQLVVKKDEFQVGDLCVYCEIDSVMPDREEFQFLKPRGMRIKTIRLRGQISQGICFPLSILPEGVTIRENIDVTEILGITKYEPPIPVNLAGIVRGIFPSFIPKTDETRVQILQDLIDKYQGELCYFTEKLDGASVTYYLNQGDFGVCSRNLDLLETPDNTLWKVARELKVEEKLRSLNANFALQGELIGAGIQGNKYKLSGQTVYFFNWFNIDESRYLDFTDFVNQVQSLGWKTVPILHENYPLENDINRLVALSINRSVLNPNIQREGIVIRPLQEKYDLTGRVSFKVINPEFLLKYE